ncbi:hypothetical protein Srot_2109 [Segniliparus rotundus DSM 44985]|uniref:Uncharacterized protein n=1 Tax=Segniliparus rotundus (strain ATCC BAA-972 / CDC 1076 / CIP 108378 / DSM 44985 / JCM 13578) TaxID=640132 RepID=D6Z9D3_SEGRD|nr:hypothetical protein [Segniliparus rotundus]ADG98563.1 hypothetical protein Srot_2109 [Segniliparus rotundus DSM 44985]
MAGRSPAPKPPSKRARRNTDAMAVTVLPFEPCEQSALPEDVEWPERTREHGARSCARCPRADGKGGSVVRLPKAVIDNHRLFIGGVELTAIPGVLIAQEPVTVRPVVLGEWNVIRIELHVGEVEITPPASVDESGVIDIGPYDPRRRGWRLCVR